MEMERSDWPASSGLRLRMAESLLSCQE